MAIFAWSVEQPYILSIGFFRVVKKPSIQSEKLN
jgi:hypothetical protein